LVATSVNHHGRGRRQSHLTAIWFLKSGVVSNVRLCMTRA
jgi:hypothetical protein